MLNHDPNAAEKALAARYAAGLVEDGMVVGLGTGSTAHYLIEALGERVREGLRIIAVPTSEASAQYARTLGIPLATLEERPRLDLDIDGADEVDPRLNLIKGHGGALLREKIVALSASRFVVTVHAAKLVERLGTTFPIPVEVVRFGWIRTRDELAALGLTPALRGGLADPFVTDNGNYILDCHATPEADLAALAAPIKALTGVVEHGLFIDIASKVIVAGRRGDQVEVLKR